MIFLWHSQALVCFCSILWCNQNYQPSTRRLSQIKVYTIYESARMKNCVIFLLYGWKPMIFLGDKLLKGDLVFEKGIFYHKFSILIRKFTKLWQWIGFLGKVLPHSCVLATYLMWGQQHG
jgi:hypothetical protein